MPGRSLDDLGELQTAVMNAVWDLGEATVGQVRDRLAAERELAYTTVLSVLQKLEKAGWLKHRADGRSYIYTPRRSRNDAGRSALRRFNERMFGGAAPCGVSTSGCSGVTRWCFSNIY
jgi:predicted transcriptional regulator